MTGMELMVIGACGIFLQDSAQEELAQRQLDAITALEKARAPSPPYREKLSWEWPQSITGLRVIYAVLGLTLAVFVVTGVKCLFVVI